ncbi:MAG TPA: hypothetical protein ENH90_00390 [bacterium]|nr:hypothetical protein [bacterium]
MAKLEVKDKAIRPVRRMRQLVITPKRISLIVFVLFLILVGLYFHREIGFLTKAPALEVSQPPTDITIKQETFEIIGTTDPSAYLTVNDKEVYINKEGNFKTEVNLLEGVNTITIQAKNRFDKINEIIIRIIYQP